MSKQLDMWEQQRRSFAYGNLKIENPDITREDIDKAAEELQLKMNPQLPESMQNCTIIFRQCEKGHGWLSATNWIQHGCLVCKIESLQVVVKVLCAEG